MDKIILMQVCKDDAMVLAIPENVVDVKIVFDDGSEDTLGGFEGKESLLLVKEPI